MNEHWITDRYRCNRCGTIWLMFVGCWCPKCGIVPSAEPYYGKTPTGRLEP